MKTNLRTYGLSCSLCCLMLCASLNAVSAQNTVPQPYLSAHYRIVLPQQYRSGPSAPSTSPHQYGGYGGSQFPGYIYPGLPNSSVTFFQPDGYGGYIFGSYSQSPCGDFTVPSVYGLYSGLPGYIYVDEGYVQDILPVSGSYGYYDGYQPNQNPGYQVNEYNYTVNNYYEAPSASDQQSTPTQPTSGMSEPQSQPATNTGQGYNAALADIQQAWLNSDFGLLSKHLPAAGSAVDVSLNGQKIYSVESNHFGQMTEDAFQKLTTYGFVLNYVQKQSDGSATGYVTQTYAPATATDGTRDTMYLAFTLKSLNGIWTITGIDSSTTPIIRPSQSAQSSASTGVIDADR